MHFPWCIKKCPYCDFLSYPVGEVLKIEEADQKAYIEALIRDFNYEQKRFVERKINTIFLGGGTPSLFSPEMIEQLLDVINSSGNLAENAEISMEINPGTVSESDLHGYYLAGVNRLSIGVQTFEDSILKQLGRIHTSDDSLQALEWCSKVGFNNINIDLMFALPRQTAIAAMADIEMAISYNPQHISYYQLTIEHETDFYKNPPSLPNEELSWTIFQQGRNLLLQSRYQNYEVSAYCRDGKKCQHNVNYWEFGDYMAIGVAAHGKISHINNGEIYRYAKQTDPRQYMIDAGSGGVDLLNQKLNQNEIIFEFFMNVMRLGEGWSIGLFFKTTGLSQQVIEPIINKAIVGGFLERDQQHIYPTEKGKNFLDSFLSEYF